MKTNTNGEVDHIRRLIDQHQNNIYHLEEMLAMHGAEKPLHLLNSLAIERESLKKNQQKIQHLLADDENSETPPVNAMERNNLPRRSYFVGRLSEQGDIISSLKPESRTFIVGIEGLGGVGKSALAIEVGYKCLEEEIFKAAIWISAKETVLTLSKIETQIPDVKTLADIFLTIGEILGYPTIGNLQIEEQKKKVYSLLAEQSTLLIIDNFETLSRHEQSDILAFLRNTPLSVKAIITSRERILDGHSIRLHGLSFDESLSLLNWGSHQKNLSLSAEQQKKLIEISGVSPLAIFWVQGQVSVFGYSIDHIFDRLSLDTDVPLLQYCFNHSWELLQQTESRQILLTMALHVDLVSRSAIKEINNLDDEKCDERISDLIHLSLIYHEADKDYFGILPLTRRFLRAYFAKNRSFITAAEWRITQYYANKVSQNSSFQDWRNYPQLLLDRNNILNSAQWCYKVLQKNYLGTMKKMSHRGEKIAHILVQIGLQFGSVLWQRAYWYDRLTLAHAALDASRLLNDWRSVSTLSRNIAWIYFYQGDNLRALHWAESSLEAIQKVGSPMMVAAAKRSLGMVQIRLGNLEIAKRLLSEVLDISTEHLSKDDYAYYSLGFAQNGMGDLEFERNNYPEARAWYQKALETWQSPERKDPIRHISYSLNGLGFVALKEGKTEEATCYFNRSIQAAEQYGRLDELARGKLGLATLLLEARMDAGKGISLTREAIEVFNKQGMQHEVSWAQGILDDLTKLG